MHKEWLSMLDLVKPDDYPSPGETADLLCKSINELHDHREKMQLVLDELSSNLIDIAGTVSGLTAADEYAVHQLAKLGNEYLHAAVNFAMTVASTSTALCHVYGYFPRPKE